MLKKKLVIHSAPHPLPHPLFHEPAHPHLAASLSVLFFFAHPFFISSGPDAALTAS